MNEDQMLEELNLLRCEIYLYNFVVERSPLGFPWVRLRSYSCLSFDGEKQPVQDFNAFEMKEFFLKNQGNKDGDHLLSNLEDYITPAGPRQYIQ